MRGNPENHLLLEAQHRHAVLGVAMHSWRPAIRLHSHYDFQARIKGEAAPVSERRGEL